MGEAQDTAGVMGVMGEVKACWMMLGEVPAPAGDIELIVLWPLRTEPNPVSSESTVQESVDLACTLAL